MPFNVFPDETFRENWESHEGQVQNLHKLLPMGVLHINDLEEGMVLAEDVKNRHGNILLPQGRPLTGKDILILKTWGITETDVEGVDRDKVESKEMESLPPSVIAAIERELTELFTEITDNPVMEEIYRIVKKYKLKQALTEMEEDEAGEH
jgi:hypothetical protein